MPVVERVVAAHADVSSPSTPTSRRWPGGAGGRRGDRQRRQRAAYREVAEICARDGAGLVIMHTAPAPKQRVQDPALYADVTADVDRVPGAAGAGPRGRRAAGRDRPRPRARLHRRPRRRSRCCAGSTGCRPSGARCCSPCRARTSSALCRPGRATGSPGRWPPWASSAACPARSCACTTCARCATDVADALDGEAASRRPGAAEGMRREPRAGSGTRYRGGMAVARDRTLGRPAGGRPADERLVARPTRARGRPDVAVPEDLHPAAPGGAGAGGIESLYSHQAEALEAAGRARPSSPRGRRRGSRCASTSPRSTSCARDTRARALYLYPTKALAQDQARALHSLGLKAACARRSTTATRRARSGRRSAARQPRPHQPRHAARRDPAQPPRLGRLVRQPGGGRGRRGARLPRASSAPTWATCCGACAGSPTPTGPSRASCSPPPRSPTPSTWPSA